MKKITKYKITQEHLLVSILQSLLYWLAYDLNNFLNENKKDERKILKNIGEICLRKKDLIKIINSLSNIDADIECSLDKQRIDMYSDFSIQMARNMIEKPILDHRPEDIKETLIEEEEEFENNFMTTYMNHLDKNDPAYIFINISSDLEAILKSILVLQIDDDEYNADKSKEIIIQVNALKSKISLIKQRDSFSQFLVEEIARINTKKEDIKVRLIEDVISQWLDIFERVESYCNNILDALNDQELKKIYEKTIEVEWINLNILYSSLYILRGYCYLTEYRWIPVRILSAPKLATWDKVI